MTAFVFSFHSAPAEAIYERAKLYEYRRRRVRVEVGDRVLVYEVAPVAKVTGAFRIASVTHGPPDFVLSLSLDEAREQARPYLDGCAIATAIRVADVERFAEPLDLRTAAGLGRAPQSYCRAKPPELRDPTVGEVSASALLAWQVVRCFPAGVQWSPRQLAHEAANYTSRSGPRWHPLTAAAALRALEELDRRGFLHTSMDGPFTAYHLPR